MKIFACLLLVIALTLPLLVSSDDDMARRGLSSSGGLKGSSERRDQSEEQETSRQLTWSRWSWYKKKKNKNKPNYKPSYNNNYPTSIGVNTPRCDCKPKTKKFEITAFMGNADLAASSVSEIGGKYIWNTALSRNAAFTEPFGDGSAAFITGDCTRFQDLTIEEGTRLLGAGLCTFVVSVITAKAQGSMVLQGELFDVIPSTFSISSGTQNFVGVTGEVVLTPFYDDEEGGTDVFTEASHIELLIKARILEDAL